MRANKVLHALLPGVVLATMLGACVKHVAPEASGTAAAPAAAAPAAAPANTQAPKATYGEALKSKVDKAREAGKSDVEVQEKTRQAIEAAEGSAPAPAPK